VVENRKRCGFEDGNGVKLLDPRWGHIWASDLGKESNGNTFHRKEKREGTNVRWGGWTVKSGSFKGECHSVSPSGRRKGNLLHEKGGGHGEEVLQVIPVPNGGQGRKVRKFKSDGPERTSP